MTTRHTAPLFDPEPYRDDSGAHTLTARVTADLRAEVLAVGAAHGDDQSSAVRRLLRAGLASLAGDPSPDVLVLEAQRRELEQGHAALDAQEVPGSPEEDGALPIRSRLLLALDRATFPDHPIADLLDAPEAERQNRPAPAKPPGRATQRADVLRTLVAFADRPPFNNDGNRGLTVDQIVEALEALGKKAPTNGIARRMTDLVQAGAARPALDTAGEPIRRATRNGREAPVYVPTPLGRQWRDELQSEGPTT